jgi:Glyoxalase-like domain
VAKTFEIVFDCADPTRVGTFWAAALGYEDDRVPEAYASWEQYDTQHGIKPNVGWGCFDPGGTRPNLFFQRVPERKTFKNRLHFDLKVPDMEVEVQRLLDLGAHVAEVIERTPGEVWTVMQDPEGNEFCVMAEESQQTLATA